MSNKSVTALMDQVSALFPPEVVAVAPGACTAELAERLKAAPKKEWIGIVEDHAKARAEEVCHLYKDGDLYYRNGDIFACMYSVEFEGS